MVEIKLRADEAREMAVHVRNESDAAESQMSSLESYLSNLASSFTGQAANAFEDSFMRWRAGSKQMLEGLTALGHFLTRAADVIEETDTRIAQQLKG